jgi:hypothetical protein
MSASYEWSAVNEKELEYGLPTPWDRIMICECFSALE